MRRGWESSTLGETCQIKPPKSEARQKYAHDALVSFAPMEDLGIDTKYLSAIQTRTLGSVVGSYTYFADGDVLLAKITPCFENGKLGIATNLENGVGFGSSEYIVFRPGPSVEKEWLYYFLSRESFREEGAERMSGAVGHKRVAKDFIEAYPIPVPPIAEQQRIVGILDEAFDGIAAAKANFEANLRNARALFESHLQSVFTQRGEDWIDRTIAQSFKVRSGDFLPARAMDVSGDIDVYGGNGVAGKHNESNLMGDNILIGRVGAKCGNVRRVQGDVWVTDNAFFVSEYFHAFDLGFLARALDRQQLRSTANQAAQPVISYTTIKDVTLAFPISTDHQIRIANELDVLEGETQRLESIYQRKLAALDALKKSLLHQAFSGAL